LLLYILFRIFLNQDFLDLTGLTGYFLLSAITQVCSVFNPVYPCLEVLTLSIGCCCILSRIFLNRDFLDSTRLTGFFTAFCHYEGL